ncbi:hypothetical protein IEQ34_002224 [Dendrobium chrysotoxum]|uniref:Ubiquitin-like domain-containing protein n=1 Tax=Dendrobium chrysotoxum TaxID=161865 RepID=A0AAV7HMV4_DENCH|nr:hypothetical protein IEQ34_002224 [Dendrobium chrysotoxum]
MSSAGQEQNNKPNQTSSITLKIRSQNGNEILYNVKPSIKFRKIMNHYCNRQSLQINTVVFLFDGRRLRDEQTPKDLGMEDGDEIDAMLHQIGGKWQALNKKPNEPTILSLKVNSQDGEEVLYRAKPTTKLSKLMNDYCNRHSFPINSIAFVFDGRRLRDEDTPESLKMEDGDEIDALIHQTGA